MSTYRVYIHYKAQTKTPFYVGRASGKYRPYSDKSRNPFWKAITNKYDWEVRVIGGSFSKEYASRLEQRLIKLYSRAHRLTNLTAGGDGCVGFTHSDKAKDSMSKKRLGVSKSLEWKQKISEGHKARVRDGAPPPSSHYTEDSLRKLSEAGKRRRNKANSKSKPVICLSTGEVFVSCAHAANSHNVNKDNLLKHLQGKPYYKSIGKRIYKWQ
jgi:hypothetical protein